MSTFKKLNKKLDGYVNLYKWVNGWQCQSTENKMCSWIVVPIYGKYSDKKKGHLIYVVKLSKWRKPSWGKAEKRIHYVVKLRQNISLTWVSHTPRYAHNPQNFITRYFLYRR